MRKDCPHCHQPIRGSKYDMHVSTCFSLVDGLVELSEAYHKLKDLGIPGLDPKIVVDRILVEEILADIERRKMSEPNEYGDL